MISMNCRPPRAIEASRLAALPPVKIGLRNSRNGNIGSATRTSTATNPARMATPPISPASTHGLVQPMLCPPYGWMPYVMAASTAVRPIAKVALPHQSMRALRRIPVSCNDLYAQMVPMTPTGTLTQKMDRQFHSASTPPSTSPMNDPAMPATMLMPRAMPRWLGGNTSVRMAIELAMIIEPPIAWITRSPISHSAPLLPVNGSSESAMDMTVNTAKPAL